MSGLHAIVEQADHFSDPDETEGRICLGDIGLSVAIINLNPASPIVPDDGIPARFRFDLEIPKSGE